MVFHIYRCSSCSSFPEPFVSSYGFELLSGALLSFHLQNFPQHFLQGRFASIRYLQLLFIWPCLNFSFISKLSFIDEQFLVMVFLFQHWWSATLVPSGLMVNFNRESFVHCESFVSRYFQDFPFLFGQFTMIC